MTPDDLRATLVRLGLSQADLARRCGVERGAVSHWMSGRSAVPGYVKTILHQHEQLAELPRLRTDTRRYRWLLDQHRPTFSRAEALALCDALNGVAFPDPEAIPLLAENVADVPGLGERHGIDQAALVQRLRALSPVEACAVVEAAERFWSGQHAGTETALATAFGLEDASR